MTTQNEVCAFEQDQLMYCALVAEYQDNSGECFRVESCQAGFFVIQRDSEGSEMNRVFFEDLNEATEFHIASIIQWNACFAGDRNTEVSDREYWMRIEKHLIE